MKRVYVSSIIRNHDYGFGRLYVIDYDTMKIVYKKHIDNNQYRIRGMAFHNGELFMVNAINGLMIFDRSNLRFGPITRYKQIEHAHLLYSYMGQLWITSTGNDRIVKIRDFKLDDVVYVGNHKYMNKDTRHLNSITWNNGNEYHVYNKTRSVFNYTTKEVVVKGLWGLHDIAFVNDNMFIVNASRENRSCLCDINQGKVIKDILVTETVKNSPPEAQLGFVRGLAISKRYKKIFIGSAPANIHIFDIDTLNKVNCFEISNDNEYESIYDICLDEDDWK